jgi:hypothetical protein
MGPLSYIRSIIDHNIVMQCIPVIINMYTYTAYEQAVIRMITPNPYLYYYLWDCHFFVYALLIYVHLFWNITTAQNKDYVYNV